ncbi:MAG TPA: class I SAM-dependent methyltransferase [Pirellulales bacterium]|nr:class I SAM-dependent methyltransferase [Pirellulales bacterium]
MHLSFLDYLADPTTGEPLRLKIAEQRGEFVEAGLLESAVHTYRIVRGIPRFVEYKAGNYTRSFGYQWRKWPRLQFDSENVGRPMEGYTQKMWEKITGMADENVNLNGGKPNVNGAILADIGCGPGRFIEVARTKGARAIGIDYSAAVEVAEQNFKHDPNVCIVQADALNLPLKPQSLDGAFSIGVLHHTPNPKRGVQQAFCAVRPEGWFALSVYGQNGYYDFPAVQFWRKVFKRLWPVLGHYPPLVYTYGTVHLFWPVAHFVPPVGRAIRALLPFIKLPDFQWSLLDTFDSVTPSYQSAHASFEVFSWLKQAGFSNIEPTNWGFTSFRGCVSQKPLAPAQAA